MFNIPAPRFNPKKRRLSRVVSKSMDNIMTVEDEYAEFKEYDFPFENIVLEGGGVKGLAYCGAIQVSICLYKAPNKQWKKWHVGWIVILIKKKHCKI